MSLNRTPNRSRYATRRAVFINIHPCRAVEHYAGAHRAVEFFSGYVVNCNGAGAIRARILLKRALRPSLPLEREELEKLMEKS